MGRSSIGRGLGCLVIVPAAFIGLAGLTDGIGPTGWRGFAELFGWVVACGAASYYVGSLFVPGRPRRAWHYIAGLIVAAAFTLLIRWLNLYAPMAAKIAYTSTLQVIGVIAVIGGPVLLARAVRNSRR